MLAKFWAIPGQNLCLKLECSIRLVTDKPIGKWTKSKFKDEKSRQSYIFKIAL